MKLLDINNPLGAELYRLYVSNKAVDNLCHDFHYITDVLYSTEFHDKLLNARKAVKELNEFINSGNPEVSNLVQYQIFFPVNDSIEDDEC